MISIPQAYGLAPRLLLLYSALLPFAAAAEPIELADVIGGKRGFIINGANENDRVGRYFTPVGDVNGDGLDDIALSTERTLNAGGQRYVVFGKSTYTPTELADVEAGLGGFVITNTGITTLPTLVGAGIRSAGDVNGDGLDDLLLNEFRVGPDQRDCAIIVFGKQTTEPVSLVDVVSGTGGFAIFGNHASSLIGNQASEVGDLNGDNLNDVVLHMVDGQAGLLRPHLAVVFGKQDTAPIEINTLAQTGRGYIINADSLVILHPNGDIQNRTVMLQGTGDINADGLDDFVALGTEDRVAYVVFGKASTSPMDLDNVGQGIGGYAVRSPHNLDYPGTGRGDINGDGRNDFILYAGHTLQLYFKHYVVFGKSDTTPTMISNIIDGHGGFLIRGEDNFQGSSNSVAIVDDLNQDGRDEIILDTSPGHTDNTKRFLPHSSACIVYGKPEGLPVKTNQLVSTGQAFLINRASYNDTQLVDAAGDVNGDGIPDILIGSEQTTPGTTENLRFEAGRIFVVFGGSPPFPDADGDGLSDVTETDTGSLRRPWDTGTDPDNPDTDNDGVNDGAEMREGTDPFNIRNSPWPSGRLPHVIKTDDLEHGIQGHIVTGRRGDGRAGFTTSGAGDVNGDGNDDFFVVDSGRIYVLFGPIGGRGPINLADFHSMQANGFMIRSGTELEGGRSTYAAGDVNADGLDDIAVYESNGVDAEFWHDLHIIFGKTDRSTINTETFTNAGNRGFSIRIERSIAGTAMPRGTADHLMRDVNGDGLDDILVQTPDPDRPSFRTHVIFGKSDSTPILLDSMSPGNGFTIYDDIEGNVYRSVNAVMLGDVNGDGFADILVDSSRWLPPPAPGCPVTSTPYVIFGKASPESVFLSTFELGVDGFVVDRGTLIRCGSQPTASIEDVTAVISTVGDVNGDGLDDFSVDAGAHHENASYAGETLIVLGKQNGDNIDMNDIRAGIGGFVVQGYYYEQFASISRAAGDVNNDGLDDILVGTYPYSDTLTIPEECYLVYGKTDTDPVDLYALNFGRGGFVMQGENRITDTDKSPVFPNDLAGAGDVNGDGFDDIVVGAPGQQNNNLDPGHAYVFYGFQPVPPDTDADLIPDYAETGTGIFIDREDTGTDRYDPDTDGDGILDGTEIDLGTDPHDPDDFPVLSLRATAAFLAMLLTCTVMLMKRKQGTNERIRYLSLLLIALSFVTAGYAEPIELADVIGGKRGYVINGDRPEERLSRQLWAVGDINGDGFQDLAARADTFSEPDTKYTVFFGKNSFTPVESTDVDAGIGGFTITNPVPLNPIADRVNLSEAGDVNGDGLDDLIIAEERGQGAVYVVFGKATTENVSLPDVAAGMGGYAITSTPPVTDFGLSLSNVNDLNGDGLDDVVLTLNSSPAAGDSLQPRVAVIFGKEDTAPVDLSTLGQTNQGYIVNGESVYPRQVQGAGDVNGDSIDDFVVAHERGAYVVFGKATTTPVNLATVAQGIGGYAVTIVGGLGTLDSIGTGSGDVNADGYNDFTFSITPPSLTGDRIYVVLGKPNTNPVTLTNIKTGQGGFVIRQEADFSHGFYTDPSIVGDMNQDGRDEILMTTTKEPGSGEDRNFMPPSTACVVYGIPASLPVKVADLVNSGGAFLINRATYSSNEHARAAGDINGDGIADILIGTYPTNPDGMQFQRNEVGRIFVVFGDMPPFPDSDGDGLSDFTETNTGLLRRPWDTGTDPNNPDTDNDGVNDSTEIQERTDPLNRKNSPRPFGKLPHIVQTTDLAKGIGGLVITGNKGAGMAGAIVSSAGDVNGDGVADFFVFDSRAKHWLYNTDSTVYVLFGTAGALPTTTLANLDSGIGNGFVIRTSGTNARRVDAAGDINGDGLDDILVQEDSFLVGEELEDRNFTLVVFGKTDTLPVYGQNIRAGSGGGFAIVGGLFERVFNGHLIGGPATHDVNGDGRDDILTSIHDDTNGSTDTFVIFGKPDSTLIDLDFLAPNSGFIIRGDEEYGATPIQILGDINADGLADVLVATSREYADPDCPYLRSVFYVVFGQSSLDPIYLSDIDNGSGGFPIVDSLHGSCVNDPDNPNAGPPSPKSTGLMYTSTPLGDVNGDGLEDFAIGTRRDQENAIDAGESFVIFGKQGNNTIDLDDIRAGTGGFVIRGYYFEQLAAAIRAAGDVNGDGLDDILLGTNPYSDTFNIPEECYLVYGKTETSPVELYALNFGNGGFVMHGGNRQHVFDVGSKFSDDLSGAGDINGDGLDDIVVGAPAHANNKQDPGHAYVFYGFQPVPPDTDADLIPDYAETGTGIFIDREDTGTDRYDPDTDGDGILDGTEIDLGTDPHDPDDFPVLSLHRASVFLATMLVCAAVFLKRRSLLARTTRRR